MEKSFWSGRFLGEFMCKERACWTGVQLQNYATSVVGGLRERDTNDWPGSEAKKLRYFSLSGSLGFWETGSRERRLWSGARSRGELSHQTGSCPRPSVPDRAAQGIPAIAGVLWRTDWGDVHADIAHGTMPRNPTATRALGAGALAVGAIRTWAREAESEVELWAANDAAAVTG
ncbi:unnamed protein product, partial [Ectocarpus sp. 12 AP-2014]